MSFSTTASMQNAYASTAGQINGLVWNGQASEVMFDTEACRTALLAFDRPCFVVRVAGRIGLTHAGIPEYGAGKTGHHELLATLPPMHPRQLGDASFRAAYALDYAYAAGAMANGIASTEQVIALGRSRMLGSFGAAGLLPNRIEAAISIIQAALPDGPYAFNLIHSPSEEELERRAVDLYLARGVRTVEASAFLGLTPHVVRYRVAGLRRSADGSIVIGNRIIAKVSRREVAQQFMSPAPQRLLAGLVAAGGISEEQARMAEQIPMADDITVEADSGGHTDNRPLVCLLPSMLALRDELQESYGYRETIRVGAAGGIGTPRSVLAAFMMGAAYVVTGSVNQSCVEAGTLAHSRSLLAQAGMADVIMAPAADMFEMGVKVQLLKRGTLFPMRAQKLFDLYQRYQSLDEIATADRVQLERQIFKQSLDDVWQQTVAFFMERDPDQIRRAAESPKRKMALVFRWYLGLSSRWSNMGEPGREMDYQIWCGPSMGAFNDWVRSSYLEAVENRHVADVAWQLLAGAVYCYRIQHLQLLGIQVPSSLQEYHPTITSHST